MRRNLLKSALGISPSSVPEGTSIGRNDRRAFGSGSLILIFISIFIPQNLHSQDFKVVGYFPHYRFSKVNDIDFTKITHLNIAFANPDAAGNLDIPGDQDMVIGLARAANPDLVVCLSLAGGYLTPAWRSAYQDHMRPSKRSAFIEKIAEYLVDHNYDGLDVDLEWGDVDALYSGFVLELKDTLSSRNLLMTSAWPGTYRYPDISNSALAAFDFVNMMVYDLRGPWAPMDAGPHSPYTFATRSIDYWKNQGVPADKLTLGVPFYGYNFSNPSSTTSFTFNFMVGMDTAYAYMDQVGDRYYNGIPTIEAKTRLAMDEVSGIMMWELGQDALGPLSRFSLLSAIDDQIPISTDLEDEFAAGIRFYPNPMEEDLHIRIEQPVSDLVVSIRDLSGKSVLQRAFQELETEVSVPVQNLPNGFYFCTVEVDGQVYTQKLIKR